MLVQPVKLCSYLAGTKLLVSVRIVLLIEVTLVCQSLFLSVEYSQIDYHLYNTGIEQKIVIALHSYHMPSKGFIKLPQVPYYAFNWGIIYI